MFGEFKRFFQGMKWRATIVIVLNIWWINFVFVNLHYFTSQVDKCRTINEHEGFDFLS
jgi:hypothetical protein